MFTVNPFTLRRLNLKNPCNLNHSLKLSSLRSSSNITISRNRSSLVKLFLSLMCKGSSLFRLSMKNTTMMKTTVMRTMNTVWRTETMAWRSKVTESKHPTQCINNRTLLPKNQANSPPNVVDDLMRVPVV